MPPAIPCWCCAEHSGALGAPSVYSHLHKTSPLGGREGAGQSQLPNGIRLGGAATDDEVWDVTPDDAPTTSSRFV